MNPFKILKLNLYIVAIYVAGLGMLSNESHQVLSQLADTVYITFGAAFFLTNILLLLLGLYMGDLNLPADSRFYDYAIQGEKKQKDYLVMCMILTVAQILMFSGSVIQIVTDSDIGIVDFVILNVVLIIIGIGFAILIITFTDSKQDKSDRLNRGYQ